MRQSISETRPYAAWFLLAGPPSGLLSRRSLLRGVGGGLFGATLLGSAPLLSACGDSGSGGTAKELSFWNFYGPNPDGNPQSKWFVDLVELWNKNNDVKIKLRYLPVSEYLSGTALQTAFSAGKGPDIFIISPGDFLRYYNGGVLTDLTSQLKSEAVADFDGGVLDTRKVDGKVYGLPMEIEPLACKERRFELAREELLAQCRRERIEPPADGRVERIVRSALHQAEEALCLRVVSRLPADVVARVQDLASGEDDGPSLLALIKSVPGNLSLDTMLAEIDKLKAVRAVGVPAAAFADIAPKVMAGWRARAMVEAPSHLARHTPQLRVTLLAALLRLRERELTDTLVELLISTVHRIDARANKKVTQELINEFKKVTGKENLLFRIAEAALTAPDAAVREVVFPASGGEQTLRDLVAEFKSKGPTYRRTVKTTMRASYTSHYRKGLIRLLEVLQFRSSNSTHRPVIDALDLVARYAKGNVYYYPDGEHAPAHRGITGDWEELAFKPDKRGRRRVVRMVYEVCTFQALREALRCKEIWVVGADHFRNPDEDLPADFEARRHEHYGALRKPLDPTAFITELREQMRAELDALHAGLARTPWLSVKARPGGAAIKLEPLDALPEPRNLRRLKREIERGSGARCR